jgi:hypothetical protein
MITISLRTILNHDNRLEVSLPARQPQSLHLRPSTPDRGYKHLNNTLAIDPKYEDAKRLLQSLVGIEKTIDIAALAAEELTGSQTRG